MIWWDKVYASSGLPPAAMCGVIFPRGVHYGDFRGIDGGDLDGSGRRRVLPVSQGTISGVKGG